MLRLAQSIILSTGWPRRLIALASGAAGALALPPLNFFPAFFIPMVVAVWLIDGSAGSSGGGRSAIVASLRASAGAGWWLGFGYFLAGLWWLGAAFLVDADQFAWLMPLGVLCLPAVLAVYTALGFAVARLLWMPGWPRIFALAVGLGLSEWLRGHAMTGFPWNDFGMVLGANLYLAQFASLTGLYGLTVLAVVIFALPALLADHDNGRILPIVLPVLALVALAGFGAARLAGGETAYVAGVRLRIIQPNLQHDLKFQAMAKSELMDHFMALSDRSTSPQHTGLADVTHLIWPESPFPFILTRDPQAMALISQKLPSGTILLTGAARLGGPASARARPSVFNSILVIASDGSVLDTYDKVHLVPFGEYVPFESVLRRLGIQQFVISSFSSGSIRRFLSVPGLPPVVPLICYEAIFSGAVVPDGLDAPVGRPGLFLNVTDDSWFGLTPGPWQHLAQAKLRAIEEGVPVVRAAETGISAIIDPYGRLIASLPLGTEGVLDGGLPVSNGSTPFARNRFLASLTIWFLALISNCAARWRV